MAKNLNSKEAKAADIRSRAILLGLSESATEAEVTEAELKAGDKGDNTDNGGINKTNDSNAGISVIPKDEFMDRLSDVILKHKPSSIDKDSTEAEVLTAMGRFPHDIGRQISNHFPEIPTGKIVMLLDLMFKGQYQNDEMLKALEEMPEGGYGY